MKVKVCHQSKRATMQQTQADSLLQTKADPALRFLIEDAVASHSSLKMVLVVCVRHFRQDSCHGPDRNQIVLVWTKLTPKRMVRE
jgi:hypothetical protein